MVERDSYSGGTTGWLQCRQTICRGAGASPAEPLIDQLVRFLSTGFRAESFYGRTGGRGECPNRHQDPQQGVLTGLATYGTADRRRGYDPGPPARAPGDHAGFRRPMEKRYATMPPGQPRCAAP